MLLKEIYDTEMQMMDKYRRNYAYTYNTNSYGRSFNGLCIKILE